MSAFAGLPAAMKRGPLARVAMAAISEGFCPLGHGTAQPLAAWGFCQRCRAYWALTRLGNGFTVSWVPDDQIFRQPAQVSYDYGWAE